MTLYVDQPLTDSLNVGAPSVQRKSWLQLIIKHAIMMLSALLLLSPMGANLLLVIGGNYYPEPAALVLILIVSMLYPAVALLIKQILSSYIFLVATAMCVIAALLGALLNGVDIIQSYAATRSFLVFAASFSLVFVVYNKSPDFQREFFVNVKCMSIYTLLFAYVYFMLFAPPTLVKSAYSIGAIILLGFLAVYEKSIRSQISILFLIMFCAVTSSYRAYIFYTLILAAAVFIYPMLTMFGRRHGVLFVDSQKMKKAAALFGFFWLTAPIAAAIATQWVMASESRYHQIVYKMEQQYEEWQYGSFDADADARVGMLSFFVKNIHGYLLPSGFFDRQSYTMESPWMSESVTFIGSSPSRDGGLLFLCISFGFVFVALFSTMFILKMIFVLSSLPYADSLIRIMLFVPCVILLFSMGNVFLVIDVAFYFGISLGICITAFDKRVFR
jgi:hypothetical protein